MSARTADRLAWTVCASTLSLLALVMRVVLLGWSVPLPRGQTPWPQQAITVAGIAGGPILGGLIASRRPRNP